MIQKFEFCNTDFEGAYLIKPFCATDIRGAFIKDYSKEVFSRQTALSTTLQRFSTQYLTRALFVRSIFRESTSRQSL